MILRTKASLLLVLLYSLVSSMENCDFENLLGKKYTDLNKYVDSELKVTKYKNGYYVNSSYLQSSYYEMPYNFITLITDGDKKIQSLTLHFEGIMDKKMFSDLLLKYGEPSKILVVNKEQKISSGISQSKNFDQHLTKRKLKLREGIFDDKPLFISWNLEKFKIEVVLKHKDNSCQLTFVAIS